jgi:hypothetical protein
LANSQAGASSKATGRDNRLLGLDAYAIVHRRYWGS